MVSPALVARILSAGVTPLVETSAHQHAVRPAIMVVYRRGR